MLLAVTGFGSIWKRRLGRDPANAECFTREAVFYNTTGVPVDRVLRARSRVYGVARFDGCSGFTPHSPVRVLNRVFECTEPCTWNGENRVVFRRLLAPGVAPPDAYLVVIRTNLVGWIDVTRAWRSETTRVISSSQSQTEQEVMVLMPAFGWVRGAAGLFMLEPEGLAARAQLVRSE